ncbi:putative DNA photolyase [Leptomonas seymouri]|uniref:Putative DNA photolyase n=1 Tax=Leptomonas seymouri TaxID=5684 RepID=A0A0N1HXX3_LEPSE|nr:putative DNA photolyase [Leptomonas seymouri]|eukprot:KPI86303.1 putative DNA photolyase [Leptomonas seymouri]
MRAPTSAHASTSRGLLTLTRSRYAPENNNSSDSTDGSYLDYFFDLRPGNNEAAASPSPSPSPPSFPPPPPPMQPPSLPPAPADVSAGDWIEFQQYLRQTEDMDPEFLAYAEGFTPPVVHSSHHQRHGLASEDSERAEALAEAAHLWSGASARIPCVTVQSASASKRQSSPLPSTSMEDVAALDQDLAQEVALDQQLETKRDSLPSHEDHSDASGSTDSADATVEFGYDVDEDARTLATLKGRSTRLQNVADTVTAPLLLPDRDGQVTAPSLGPSPTPLAPLTAPSVRLLSSKSYLAQQDRLYLGPHTPPEAQLLPQSTAAAASRQCILVVFSSNDLRVHDNYSLALASVRARTASASHSGAGAYGVPPIPVIAVCVLDYRTFAQPSIVGGFFRRSPQRAQFLLDTVAALRLKLECELQVPLLVRCGRPEEHVPRLAAELGATDVFMTTQYAPHERRVQALMMQRLRKGTWVSREDVLDAIASPAGAAETVGEEDPLVLVVEHLTAQRHPYGEGQHIVSAAAAAVVPPVAHSVWQTTLVHLDDLPTPLAAMKEGERWYHDDVTVSTIRPTAPYDSSTQQLADLPITWQQSALLPSQEEREGRVPPPVLRGALPTLEDLGYATGVTDFAFQEVVATQSSHPQAGENAALARMDDWLAEGGMTSLLRYGRERRTNTKMYSQKLARVSPYIAIGALSPRKYYEVLRAHAHANLQDGFVQQQFREGLLRLSRRDYWHWMGLRFGDRLFFSYGPHPEQTDEVPDWRHDTKVVQRWCNALTGIPFADAAMRELVGTGFVAHEGRQALAWLLARGYGQDWRLGAEWMERCSLDYDPFVCYGNFAYSCGIILDDFGEPVRNVHHLAHHHDQTGIYIKKWLPQLSKVPPVYIHRPHVLTARMQAMHNVYLGHNYPYPLKLWQGAQRTLSGAELTAYYAQGIEKGPGYAEALRYGSALMPPEELHAAVSPAYLQHRAWAQMLPASAFADVREGTMEAEMEVMSGVLALAGAPTAAAKRSSAGC